jgi:phage baseplate assembly protein W
MALKQYQIVQGDSISHIARRELGDAQLWLSVALLNRLDYPFVDTTLSPSDRDASGKNIAIIGDTIKLPPVGEDDPELDREFVSPSTNFYDITLKRDVELDVDGDLVFDNASEDLRLVSGVENMVGALRRRLQTFKGELAFHALYGSNLHLLIGEPNDARLIAQARVESVQALLQDERVLELANLDASIEEDVLAINAFLFVAGQPDTDALEADFEFNRKS